MKIEISTRAIWAVAFPIMIAGISENVVEITDTMFLAHYGIVELGAIGLADSLFEVVIFLCAGLAGGIQIMVARRAGEGRDREIGRIFNHGLALLVATSAFLTVFVKLAAPYLTDVVASSVRIGRAIDDFLQIYAFAIFFHTVNLAYVALYMGIVRTRILMGAAVVLAVTNIVLDFALIFGNLGAPELGIQGAAYASLAAEIAAFLVLTAHMLARLPMARYGLFRLEKWRASLTRSLFNLSLPMAMEALLETGRWFLFFVILERMGETPLAVSNVVYVCYALFIIPIEGLSEAACTMVSNLLGQGKADSVGSFLRKAMSLGAIVALPVLGIALLVPETILSLFSDNSAVVGAGVDSLRVIAIATAVIVVAEMVSSAVAGTGDTGITFAIELVFTVVTLAYAYTTALILRTDLVWVWTAEIVGWVLVLALSSFWLKGGFWRRLEL
jgi:MATE family multidrug resistance protein